jgi:hypothetical protein
VLLVLVTKYLRVNFPTAAISPITGRIPSEQQKGNHCVIKSGGKKCNAGRRQDNHCLVGVSR